MAKQIPILVEIEGPEFAGKSTQVKELNKFLSTFSTARLPGYTELGEKIRHMLKYDDSIKGMSQFGLVMASHYSALEKMKSTGESFIIDRGIMSALVYQGYMENLIKTNKNAFTVLLTDYYTELALSFQYVPIYIRIDADEIIRRRELANRETEIKDAVDRYDSLDKSNFEKMVEAYDKACRRVYFQDVGMNPAVYVIDGTLPPEQITKSIYEHILCVTN